VNPTHYTDTNGLLTFPAGTTSRSVTVPVHGGAATEPNLNFLFNLTNPSAGSTLADAQGVGTILGQQMSAADISQRDFLNTSNQNTSASAPATSASLLSSGSAAPATIHPASAASIGFRAFLSDAAHSSTTNWLDD